MLELIKYTSTLKEQWNDVISRSKNGTFLFYRDYMDYHSDRFKDYSFIITRKGKFEAVILGNIVGQTFYSHQGLTYGGLIFTSKIGTNNVLDIFQLLICELKKIGINEIIYKPVPYIYHTMPSQEDLYALFRIQAEKIACFISSTIFQGNKPNFIELRKRGVKKSTKEGVTFKESNDYESFWEILQSNLEQKYGLRVVHSVGEIKYLQSKFPENIKLFIATKDEQTIAGVVVYVMKHVVHAQYIAANDSGKETGALDLIFHELINNIFLEKSVFDFGHSTEKMGHYLNENLLFQKEGFGGRGIVYEVYKINVNHE